VPTLSEICANVRLLADDPMPQRPSARRVLLAVLQATQSLYNRLENTGQAWSIKPDYQLVVSSSTSDYLLAVDDSYGKPIQVLSYYPSNQAYIQRPVDFVEFQDLHFRWPYPVNMANYIMNDGSNCTAMRMAFYYRDDGTRWVRVLPQPQLPAVYLVTFASGNWAANAALVDSPVLSQFHPLVEFWATESLLPSCQWSSDQRYNMDHRKEIAVALKNDEDRITDEFERYVRNLTDDRMGERVSSLDDDSVGAWGGWS
jgi:hypothetical protein